MKKVLHLLASSSYSGAENVVCTIIENFGEEYNMAYSSPKGSIQEVLAKRNIKYYSMDKFDLKNVKRVIKEYNPNIIHAHDYKASFFAALSGFKGKIISHIHNNCNFAKSWNPKTVLYKLVINKFSSVVGVSDKVYEEAVYKKALGDKYVTIHNFVDKGSALEKANAYQFDKYYDLFYIGRLSDEKNPIGFIEVVKELFKKHPSVKAVIIGDGVLKDKCKDLINQYNLNDNIEMLGFLSNPFPIIKNSKVGIMPSIWEGFGLTAIESMILGKPVLNSGAGGLGRIFENNTELICEKLEDYVDKYEEIIKNNEGIYRYDVSEFTNKEEWKKKINMIYKRG